MSRFALDVTIFLKISMYEVALKSSQSPESPLSTPSPGMSSFGVARFALIFPDIDTLACVGNQSTQR